MKLAPVLLLKQTVLFRANIQPLSSFLYIFVIWSKQGKKKCLLFYFYEVFTYF